MSRDQQADIQPVTQEEALKSRLIARFGAELMRDGFIAIPRLLKKRICELGITPAQHVFWETVISFQYGEELPFPSIERIADEMGRSERSIKRYIRTMEDRGLLRVERSHNPEAHKASNRYDFTGLYEAILALDKTTESGQKGPENTSNIAEDRVNPLQSTTTGDKNVTCSHQNFSQNSSQNGHQNGHSMPKMPPNLAAEMAVEEDESQEESSQIDSSNLRSLSGKTKKGTGLNGSSTSDKQANNNKDNQNGNSKHKDQVSNNKSTKQRNESKNETIAPTEKENAPASPAWSNVQGSGDTTTPPQLPTYSANYLADLSMMYHDLAPASSQTRAAKIYAQLAKWGVDDEVFVRFLGMARKNTSQASITRRNPDGSFNSMPYFFKVLGDLAAYNMGLWAEEDRRRAEEAEEAGQNKEETS
jgi:hypothetical protein